MEIPIGYEALIRPRGSAIKNQILILNTPGTVDYDYRGEILVGVKNIGDKGFLIKKGNRVAQMTVKKFERIEFEEVEELSETERGSGRLGSTGE
jgi:dUTP pyrophosphatase